MKNRTIVILSAKRCGSTALYKTPYMEIPNVQHKHHLFSIWDRVLKHRGPIVVDKSPQYLSAEVPLKFLLDYRDSGRDVRIIGLIRDPRDAITSQYVKWHRIQTKKTGIVDTPERREAKWLEKYKNLEYVLSRTPGMLMVKYEDFATDTYRIVRQICKYCGIQYQGGMAAHVVPTNIGRYKESKNRKIKKWANNWTPTFKKHLKHFGYI
jgi:hypothetical protein